MLVIVKDKFNRKAVLDCAEVVSVHGVNTYDKEIRKELGLSMNMENTISVDGIVITPAKCGMKSMFVICNGCDKRVEGSFVTGSLYLLDCGHAYNSEDFELEI